MRLATAALLALVVTSPLVAQDAATDEARRRPPKPKPNCLDGAVYDDKKRFESGLRPGSLAARGDFVMLFEAPEYPAKLNKVCVAFWRTSFWNEVFFDLRVWSADGPNGGPGTLLDEVRVLGAGKVTRKPKFYTYDVSWANIVVDGPVYIGPSWDPLDAFLVYLAVDDGPKTPRRRGFYGGVLFDHEVTPPANELGISIENAPRYRALGVRAVFGPP